MIDIVLATFNGSSHVGEQVRSILDCEGFDERVNSLIVVDDNSSDDTLRVIRETVGEKYSDKLRIHVNSKRMGPCQNFAGGMELSTADYLMFADQDDVWQKQKIRAMDEAMRSVENGTGTSVPVLCFADMQVVSDRLELLHPSFYQCQGLVPETNPDLLHLAIQNIVPGCSCICNRALIEKALPMPDEAVMHDWWLALTATAFGQLCYVPKTYQMYRQHAGNEFGASPFRLTTDRFRASIQNLLRDIRQTKAFVDRYSKDFETRGNGHDLKRLRDFSKLDKSGTLHRLTGFATGKYKKRPLLQNLAFGIVLAIGLNME